MDSINTFSDFHVPILWEALIGEYGRQVTYLPDHDDTLAFPLLVLWKEGAEDEDVSPGRYSNIWVRHADFIDLPLRGDGVVKEGNLYDVVRVDATASGCSRLVLQENNG